MSSLMPDLMGTFSSLFSLIPSQPLKFSPFGFCDLMTRLFHDSFLFVCWPQHSLHCQLFFFYSSLKHWSSYCIHGLQTTSFTVYIPLRILISLQVSLLNFSFTIYLLSVSSAYISESTSKLKYKSEFIIHSSSPIVPGLIVNQMIQTGILGGIPNRVLSPTLRIQSILKPYWIYYINIS